MYDNLGWEIGLWAWALVLVPILLLLLFAYIILLNRKRLKNNAITPTPAAKFATKTLPTVTVISFFSWLLFTSILDRQHDLFITPLVGSLFGISFLLAVGDVVTDAFIRLLDNQQKIEYGKDGQPDLSVPFGTKIPYDFSEIVAGVGNAANAAVAFAKLGFESGLVSNVGSDNWGREIIDSLEDKDVDTRFVHINRDKKSNYHYVLWYKSDRTILIKHEEYAYHWPHFRIIDIPKWIYFSSVSKNALEYHDELAAWLEGHPSVQLAFQPGTFQIRAGVSRMKKIYH